MIGQPGATDTPRGPSPEDEWDDLVTEAIDSRLHHAIRTGQCPKDLLVAGPAGSGKTYGILRVLHWLLWKYRGLRVLACRATRAACTESFLVTYERGILPRNHAQFLALGVNRRSRQVYRYPTGSELVIGGLDNPDRILSTEWDVVYINEAKEATEEAWETIRSRLGRPGTSTALGLLIGDTNPADPSHWLKLRADRGLTTLWEAPHQANPALWDGEDWTEAGERYRGELAGLTGTRHKRLYLGLWAAGEGVWFAEAFDPHRHVTDLAEYDPALPVHLAVDTGVFTGAVFFQVNPSGHVNVFADYLAENRPARANAAALRRLAELRCEGQVHRGITDPAGGARNPVGPVVIQEYKDGGLTLQPWDAGPGSVLQGLEALEALVNPGTGPPRLTVHPRCRHTIDAFLSYRRAKRAGQWADYPEDPQHPAEDLMDALRGGIYKRVKLGPPRFY